MLDISKGCYWLGHPGNLNPIADYVGELGVDDDEALKVTPLLGGGQQIRVGRKRALRSWKVSIPDATVADIKPLRTLLASTLPPYVWVDPWAQVTNLLTPEQSVLGSTTPQLPMAGSYYIAGSDLRGWASYRPNPGAAGGALGAVTIGPAPCPPWWAGRKVTASALLATNRGGGANAVLEYLDGTGNVLADGGTVNGNYVTGMDGLRRSVATGSVPFGAAACRVRVRYAELIAEPQITWTDIPVDYDVGNGALQVVVHNQSRSLQWSVPGPDAALRRQDISFQVTEYMP